MTQLKERKTKQIVLRERDIMRFNEKYDANVCDDCRVIGFCVPAEMNIEEREVELLLAAHAGLITVKEMKAHIEDDVELKDIMNDE